MKKIYPIQWLEHHPYATTDATDRYYCDLVNKLLKIIWKYDVMAGRLIDDKDIESIYENTAIFTTAWFEDIISQTGLWQVFTSECKKRYGSRLPFYELDDNYYPDEINLEDVNFILWHCIQYWNMGKTVYNPENHGLAKLAKEIYTLLDHEYETAPENERLQEFYNFSLLAADDYLEYRNRIEWFFMNSYINDGAREDYLISQEELIQQLENKNMDDKTADIMLYAHKVNTILFTRTPLLGITAPEYIKLLQENKNVRLDSPYTNISSVKEAFYLIDSEADEYFIFKTLTEQATTYKVSKKSLDSNLHTFVPGDTIVTSTLFKYGQYWHHNGVMMNYRISKNPGILEKVKETEAELSAQNAKQVYNDFIKATKGKHIVFFKDTKDMKQFFKKELHYEKISGINPTKGANDNIMLTATPEAGLCFITSLNDCVASPDNPFYNQETAEKKAIKLLVDQNCIPYEISCYLFDKGYLKDAGLNSTFGPEHGRELVQKNARFILDYFFNRCREKDYIKLDW